MEHAEQLIAARGFEHIPVATAVVRSDGTLLAVNAQLRSATDLAGMGDLEVGANLFELFDAFPIEAFAQLRAGIEMTTTGGSGSYRAVVSLPLTNYTVELVALMAPAPEIDATTIALFDVSWVIQRDQEMAAKLGVDPVVALDRSSRAIDGLDRVISMAFPGFSAKVVIAKMVGFEQIAARHGQLTVNQMRAWTLQHLRRQLPAADFFHLADDEIMGVWVSGAEELSEAEVEAIESLDVAERTVYQEAKMHIVAGQASTTVAAQGAVELFQQARVRMLERLDGRQRTQP